MKVFSYLQLTLLYTFLVPAVRCVMESLIHKLCLLTFLIVFDATSSVAEQGGVPRMLWTDRNGKEITSAETERPKQKEEGVLYSITSHIRIWMEQLEGVACAVMSKGKGTILESALLQMIEEFYLSSMPDLVYRSECIIPVFLALVCITASVLYVLHQRRDASVPTMEQSTDEKLHEVDVTLDVDTAHPNLLIDGKTVRWIKETPQRLCNEKTFDEDPYVLGIMGRAWRAYWKVNVEKKDDWVLGVTKKTVNRKGQLVLSPANGFWVIRLSNRGSLKAMDDMEHVLDKVIPNKVAIYLDYKEKKVTFFNVEDGSHIYSFTNGPSYEDDVSPLFSPWNNDTDPITILSIESKQCK